MGIANFDSFDLFCKIWYLLSTEITNLIIANAPKQITDGITYFLDFASLFFISTKYWSRRHLVYFGYYFYNAFSEKIGSKLWYKQTSMNKELRFCTMSLMMFNYAVSTQYEKKFDFKNNKNEILQWIATTNRIKNPMSHEGGFYYSVHVRDLETFYNAMNKEDKQEWKAAKKHRMILHTLFKCELRCAQCYNQSFSSEHNCKRALLLLCKRCKMIAYCSKKCQKIGWKRSHRNKCRMLRKMRRGYVRKNIKHNTLDSGLKYGMYGDPETGLKSHE